MSRSGLARRRLCAWAPGFAALAVGMILLVPALRADDAAPRAVRLSYVDGHVRIAQGSQLLADPALVNTPLFEGTEILTSDDGRAELELDDGSLVRLSPNSSLTLTALHNGSDTEIGLSGGLIYLELQGGGSGSQIRVRFDDSVVTSDGFSVLRVDLDSPPGELAVFSGNAHLERGRAMSLDLHGGESVTLNASDPSQYLMAESIEPDSWDTWNSDRDQALNTLAVSRTGATNSLPASNDLAWNDLDASGNWYNVPGTGSVWSPFEAAGPGWDPYGNGYWMWTPRFGYIWVSGNSWGYMPYQCGAWNFYNDFGWGWAPGACQPWWGGAGWLLNIGIAPVHYRPPFRPHPIPLRSAEIRPSKGNFAPVANAIVPVSRRSSGALDDTAMRDRNASVTIGGHLVEPLRAQVDLPARSVGHSRPAYVVARPVGQRPMPGVAPNGRPSSPPARSPSAAQNAAPAGRAPSSASAPASRPSSGGGGGGNSGGGGHH